MRNTVQFMCQLLLTVLLASLTIFPVKSQESRDDQQEQPNIDVDQDVVEESDDDEHETKTLLELPDEALLNSTVIDANITSLNLTLLNETTPILRTVAHCWMPEGVSVPNVDSVIAEDSEDVPTTEETIHQIPVSTLLESTGIGEADNSGGGIEIGNYSLSTVVRLVNMTDLVQEVLWSNNSIKSRVTPANCSIILFYASWCPFSAKAAPHFNALPRAFPALRAAAIDVSQHTSVNSYFGILSVPTLVLYHNGKSVAKFNDSTFSLHKFADFIQAHTDLKTDGNINVTSQDFAGPVPSVITKKIDMYLALAWIFIIGCFFYYVTKSTLWRRAVDLVRTTWREAEDHVHQD